MATVYVNDFSEFLTAAAVTGDTVVCPEGAIWDMSEIDPLSTINLITINSDITGNGTTIKNFRGGVSIKGECTVTALHFDSALNDQNYNAGGFFIRCSDTSKLATFSLCKFSVAIHQNRKFMYNVILTQCAATITFDSTAIGLGDRDSGSVGGGGWCRYNRVKIIAPSATGYTCKRWWLADSEIYMNAPLLKNINNTNARCTINGSMPMIDGIDGMLNNVDFSVINSSGAPNFPAGQQNVKPVTDTEMRSASALAAIGFVIGSDE
jgi:hypothetical protein